jgi:maleate cis-trans isomerase
MKRLGILYPPTGAEFEYYQYGESLSGGANISLMGVRISGGDDEHAIHHLEKTAEIDNLLLSAKSMKHISPDAAVWACTSGSFIRGAKYAEAQVSAMSKVLNCPVTSTALAFVAAIRHLDIKSVTILATYPDATSSIFRTFLEHYSIQVDELVCMNILSGPAASLLGHQAFYDQIEKINLTNKSALLIPDTAVALMHEINALEDLTGNVILTANQVSLWDCARLAGCLSNKPELGQLFKNI